MQDKLLTTIRCVKVAKVSCSHPLALEYLDALLLTNE